MTGAGMRAALSIFVMLLTALPATAQDMGDMPMGNMPMNGMPMNNMDMAGILGSYAASRDSSGTSWQPDAATHAAIHAMAGDWMLMGHAMLWEIYDTQSGPRGGDKLFAEGMVMGAARRDLANGDTLNLRAMFSPDPLMGRNGYPELLAGGETANGITPLLDRQHPHDLFMELAASYAHRLDTDDSVFLYAGDPGEPALGPSAYMHRPSGMDIPDAPITHHWLDSTHIAFGVLTAGFVRDDWKLEVSQFTGREPDQNRTDFDPVRLDSTAARLSWNPGPNWSLQVSWGHLVSPEQLTPLSNENRTTASATYVTALGDGTLATTLAWGLKQESTGADLKGALLEAEYQFDPWTVFARSEWEQNNELDAFARTRSVGELTLGAIHDWPLAEHFKLGIGALYAFDFAPSEIVPAYGAAPHGAMAFVRLATR